MELGIDLGTSAVKAVLTDEEGRTVAEASAPLEVRRPHPRWSEQDPDDWWRATEQALASLSESAPKAWAATRAIGLSGQMHGATLLDGADRVLRPAILWNDGRSAEACRALESAVPGSRAITGNRAMPGFTAPKLWWCRDHEPEVFGRTRRVLLPKDWLRLRMTGDAATDCSDASGTLWLDVAERRWSEVMLAASGLTEASMPRVYEGPEITGVLREEVADAWGLARVPVVAGAGDQAAGALGVGVVRPGEASLSLGTSGVLFVADDRYAPGPEDAVHAFCHALPARWHRMAVILSAASCLAWVTKLTHAKNEAALLEEAEARAGNDDALFFLPYLTGERTPHDDPDATGVFIGLGPDTNRADLCRAVLEGVAMAMADGQDALARCGPSPTEVSVIGGGARSRFWGEQLACVLDRPLNYRRGAEIGPAEGAARLARCSAEGAEVDAVCVPPPLRETIVPDPGRRDRVAVRHARWRELYQRLHPWWTPKRHP